MYRSTTVAGYFVVVFAVVVLKMIEEALNCCLGKNSFQKLFEETLLQLILIDDQECILSLETQLISYGSFDTPGRIRYQMILLLNLF